MLCCGYTWLIFPYPSGLLHWHCGNLTIAPVPAKQPWWIWINTSCEFIMNDCITTTKQSTTKPCAHFLGYTVTILMPIARLRSSNFTCSYAYTYWYPAFKDVVATWTSTTGFQGGSFNSVRQVTCPVKKCQILTFFFNLQYGKQENTSKYDLSLRTALWYWNTTRPPYNTLHHDAIGHMAWQWQMRDIDLIVSSQRTIHTMMT